MRACLVAVFLFLTSPAWATTYYVDDTGSDSNTCTQAQNSATPKLTMGSSASSAMFCLAAGDTLIVRNGTYTAGTPNHSVIYIAGTVATGTSGAPITVKAENYLGAALTIPSQNTRNAAIFTNKDWYIFEGFDISGGTSTGSSASHHGIYLEVGADNNIVRRNKFHDIARTVCSNSVLGFDGVFADTNTGNIIELNSFNAIGRLRDGESGCATTIYQNDHAIYAAATTSLTIRRNVTWDTNRGWPLHFYKSSGTTTSASIYNNTIHGQCAGPGSCPNGQFAIANAWAGTSNIKNNIFSDPLLAVFFTLSVSGTGTINIDEDLTDSTDANWFTTTVPSQVSGGAVGAGSQNNTSPGFVAVGSNDFRLAAGSAAIDSGVSVGLPYNGSAPDKGANETITHATCSVEDGDALKLRITFNNNVHPPLLPATGIAFGTNAFTARKAGADNPVTAATRVGDNRIDLTLTNAIVAGNAVDYSYSTTSGNVTDSALIGGSLNQRLNAITNQSCTNNVGAAAAHVFTQAAFKFHSLRGTEAAPLGTPYANAPENTNILVRVGGSVRLRLAITCTVADCPPTGFYPRYSKNAGGYTNVIPNTFTADNVGFCGTGPDADIPTNGTSTTAQLSTAGTFVAGALVRTSNAIPTVDIALNGKTELEYCIAFDTDATAGDTYDVRLYQQDGTALNAYTVTPRITLASERMGMGF